MAWTLKATKTFSHPFSEVPIATAYALIDDIFVDKKTKTVTISLLVYVNRSARVNGKDPVKAFSINASEPNFTTYFSPALTTSIWTQANNYLAAGGLAGTGLVVTDWQTDAQAEP
jgi:hypothetical protein